jgi:hypothetical protein
MNVPRYFFDIDDGDRLTVDEEGSDCAGPSAARDEALAVLPAIAKDMTPSRDSRTITASVRDERGRTLFRATLALTSEWLGPRPA